jgi:diguanylate cyclase (GGDEF)-like protein/PAS domain S-box-containing protein
VALNPAAEHISQATCADVCGRRLSEAFPGADEMGILAALRRVHQSGAHESLPPLQYRDDYRGEAWYTNDLYRLDSGQLIAVYSDVTADIQHRAALEESETRYRLLTESLAEGIFDWDARGDYIYLSPALKAQLGYRDSEFPNSLGSLLATARPCERDEIESAFESFIKGLDTLWDRKFQLQHKSGHYLWIHSRGTVLRDAGSGRALRLLGVHINIDEEQRNQEQSEERRKTLNALFQALPDLFFLLERDSLILDYQASNAIDLYRPPDQFVGKRMIDVLPEEVAVQLQPALDSALAEQRVTSFDYALDTDEGVHHFEARIAPIGADRAALIARNVTQRKKAEHRLQERMKELQGLYQVYRLTQQIRDIEELAPAVARLLAEAMQAPDDVYVSLELVGRQWCHGNEDTDGEEFASSIDDPDYPQSQVGIRCSKAQPPLEEEREMLAAAALAIELWIKDDRAERQLRVYERIVASTRDQIALIDADLRYALVNSAYADRVGLSPRDIQGRSVREVIQDDYTTLIEPNLKTALEGSVVQFQHWRAAVGDQWVYMNVLYTPYEESGRVRGVIASMHDITALHEAEAGLRRAAQVFSSSVEAVLMTDRHGVILDGNEAFFEITDQPRSDVLGNHVSILRSGMHSDSFYDAMLQTIAASGRWRGELWVLRKNGESFPCLMTVSEVRSEMGELTGYVGVFSDITSIKENEQRLELLANQDPLTGLSNRTQLSKHLSSRISRARSEHQPFTLMFIDLDHFKDVNDALGHSAGDRLLKLVSKRLTSVLRDNDVLARVGGDEFVAVLQGNDTTKNASVIASKILEALKPSFQIASDEVEISASVGICCYPQDGTDAETLLRNADTAMYEAKSAGRNTWRCYSEQMTEAAQRHMLILNSLRRATSRKEMSLVFQPQFDAHSQVLCGFEALLRWKHGQLGAIDTQEFIAVAEQSGLIDDLDYWVFEQVCQHIKHWRSLDLAPPRVAVNVSGRTLHDQDFLPTVSGLFKRYEIAHDEVELELTETALLPSFSVGNGVLDKVRALGLGIAVDDFGTGYSSLAYLRKLPVTELKIDASFVRDVVANADAAAITKTIFAMAQTLKLQVVAEGVETKEQLEFLQELGTLRIQGYLFSHPLSAQDAQALLEQRKATNR